MHSLSGRLRTYRHKRKIKSDDVYPSDEVKKKKKSPMLFKINTEKSEVTEVCIQAHTVYIYRTCMLVLKLVINHACRQLTSWKFRHLILYFSGNLNVCQQKVISSIAG